MRWLARILSAHDVGEPVRAVVWSPDEQWFVAAHQAGFTDIIDAATGARIRGLDRAGSQISTANDVARSADGKILAVAGKCGDVEVFDTTSGRLLNRMRHDKAVNAVSVSRDGRWIATAGDDETAQVFTVGTGAERFRIRHNGPVIDIAVSPDDRWIATAGNDGMVFVHDAATGAERHPLRHDDSVNAVVWSEDSRWLATASDDGTARILDVTNGHEASRITHDGVVNAVAFSPDGSWVATASGDRRTRVFQVGTGAERSGYTHAAPANAVAWSRDGRWVVTGADRAVVFDPMTGRARCELEQYKPVRVLQFGRSGYRILAAGDDERVDVHDWQTVQEMCQLMVHDPVSSAEGELLDLGLDGRWVATGGWHNSAVYETATGVRCRLPSGKFSPNGRWLSDGEAVFAVADGSERCRFGDLGDGTVTYEWSPSSQWVAMMTHVRTSGGYDYAAISVRGAKDGQVRWKRAAPWYRSLCWSADEQWLAHGPTVHDARTGEVRSEVAGPPFVRASALSPDGTRMLVGTDDGAYLFDAATGGRLSALVEGSAIAHVTWSPDSRLAYVANGTAWDAGTVFDARTGAKVIRVDRAGGGAFSPNGRWLALLTPLVRVIEINTDRRFLLGSGPAASLAWSADGRHLAARFTSDERTGAPPATCVYDVEASQQD